MRYMNGWGVGRAHKVGRYVACLCGVFVLSGGLMGPAQAQERIYRCGNEYTNNPGQNPRDRGCKLVEGGNITVVEGLKARPASNGNSNAKPAGSGAVGGARNSGERVDNAEQRARDSDARTILEAELRKAEARVSELRAEYGNGEPEKRGDEFRNHQRYLDRVADAKAALIRAESDVAGLRRELSRLAAPALSAPSAGAGVTTR